MVDNAGMNAAHFETIDALAQALTGVGYHAERRLLTAVFWL